MYPNKNSISVPVNGYGLPSDQDKKRILELMASTPIDKLIVFDKSIGPTDNELEYLEWIDNLCIPHRFILITSNYKYHFTKHSKIVHYPNYFFTTLNDVNLIKPDIVSSRPYKISCLSRNPWLHKSLNFVKMRQQAWFTDLQASFGAPYEHLLPSAITTDLLKLITKQDAEYLESIYPMPLKLQGDDLGKYESNACPTYQQCYVDYAPESRHDNIFISEKTWKPIFSGQFFFILGSCGIIDYLRNIGVDVFDDLIDHGYDHESNLIVKVDMLMSSITNFLNTNLDQLWIDTYHRRKKNLDLMYSPEFQQYMSADLVSRVF